MLQYDRGEDAVVSWRKHPLQSDPAWNEQLYPGSIGLDVPAKSRNAVAETVSVGTFVP